MIKKNILVFLIFYTFSLCFAQEALKSIEEEYYDFLSLTGDIERPTLGYRTLSDSVWEFNEDESLEEESDHIWKNINLGTTFTLWQSPSPVDNWFTRGIQQSLTAKAYGPEWFNSYNTASPYGQNDGSLWQGRGYNTAFTAGARLEGYGFEATFKPQVSWMENKEFDFLPGVNKNTYNYFFGGIDLVQRYGDSSFWNYDWGDSEIRWSWKSFTVGFGTQNPWLGPAYLNPMLGSNNAAGYFKVDLGFRKTEIFIPYYNIPIGNIEGRIWVGKLKESEYYDDNVSNDERMLTALSASYNPFFIPGFTIGINRIFITYWKTENLKYLFRLFTDEHSNALASSGNDEDQKISFYLDWKFEKIGFEAYGELGIDDYTSNKWTNPFHTAIYTVGVKQNIPIPFNLKSELIFEWNNFEMSQDFQLEFPYIGYYGHGFVRHGYTHKGQILGAGSGYFGNSQYLGYKVFYPKGYCHMFYHRYSPNNNYIYSKAVYDTASTEKSDLNKNWYDRYETYIVIGGDLSYFVQKSLMLDIAFYYVNVYCMNYQKTGTHSYNFQFSMKYNF